MEVFGEVVGLQFSEGGPDGPPIRMKPKAHGKFLVVHNPFVSVHLLWLESFLCTEGEASQKEK